MYTKVISEKQTMCAEKSLHTAGEFPLITQKIGFKKGKSPTILMPSFVAYQVCVLLVTDLLLVQFLLQQNGKKKGNTVFCAQFNCQPSQ